MELFDLLQQVIEAFEGLGIPYLVTGSVASMAYGEPRLTNDIDVVAAFEVKHIEGFLKRFPQNEFHISSRVLPFLAEIDLDQCLHQRERIRLSHGLSISD